MGACLYQLGDDLIENKLRCVRESNYATMQPVEIRYSVTEKEAAAIAFALRKWRVFVWDVR